MLLVQNGEIKLGIELLERASSVEPKSADIRLNLARGLIKARRKDAARKELAELAKLGDKFPSRGSKTTQPGLMR